MVNYVWEPLSTVSPLSEIPNLNFLFGALRHTVLMKPNYFLNIFSHGSLCLFFRHRKRLLPCLSGWEYLDHIVQVSPSSASGKRLEFAFPQRPQPQWTMELWTGYHSVWLPFLLNKTFTFPSFPMATSLPFYKNLINLPVRKIPWNKHAVRCY